MKTRLLHKWLGLLLVLPMLVWVLTGFVFFLKPGYTEAYEKLDVKSYPLDAPIVVDASKKWERISFLKTVLGEHLLVQFNGQRFHLEPKSLAVKRPPSRAELVALVEDAIQGKSRYGKVVGVVDDTAITSTGVKVRLDWGTLTLSQRGRDTFVISLLYKLHYLQWTPWKGVNQILGFVGLCLLFGLTALGVKLVVNKK